MIEIFENKDIFKNKLGYIKWLMYVFVFQIRGEENTSTKRRAKTFFDNKGGKDIRETIFFQNPA